jgi:hypothetical protein
MDTGTLEVLMEDKKECRFSLLSEDNWEIESA